MFNTHFLFASLIWGSIGIGYFIYGKRQRSWVPMVRAGVLMIVCAVANLRNAHRADLLALEAWLLSDDAVRITEGRSQILAPASAALTIPR